MPEHVHLLLTEPQRAKLSIALQMLKQNVARRLPGPEGGPLWQPRYYDFNVWSYAKQTEKLRYIHRNPVTRGLVQSPEEWGWVPRPCVFCKGGCDAADIMCFIMPSGLHRTYGAHHLHFITCSATGDCLFWATRAVAIPSLTFSNRLASVTASWSSVMS
jgi:Transposase IS200 like